MSYQTCILWDYSSLADCKPPLIGFIVANCELFCESVKGLHVTE